MKRKKMIIGVLTSLLVLTIVLTGVAQLKPLIIKNAELTLEVLPKPDFTLELDYVVLFVPIGGIASFVATVTSVNEFAGEITFSIEGIPPEMVEILPSSTITLGPNEPNGVQFNLMIPDDPELIGTYALTVTAESDTYN